MSENVFGKFLDGAVLTKYGDPLFVTGLTGPSASIFQMLVNALVIIDPRFYADKDNVIDLSGTLSGVFTTGAGGGIVTTPDGHPALRYEASSGTAWHKSAVQFPAGSGSAWGKTLYVVCLATNGIQTKDFAGIYEPGEGPDYFYTYWLNPDQNNNVNSYHRDGVAANAQHFGYVVMPIGHPYVLTLECEPTNGRIRTYINGALVDSSLPESPTSGDGPVIDLEAAYFKLGHVGSYTAGDLLYAAFDDGVRNPAIEAALVAKYNNVYTPPVAATSVLVDYDFGYPYNTIGGIPYYQIFDLSKNLTTNLTKDTYAPTLSGGQLVFNGAVHTALEQDSQYPIGVLAPDQKITIYCVFTPLASGYSGMVWSFFSGNPGSGEGLWIYALDTGEIAVWSGPASDKCLLGIVPLGVEYVVSVTLNETTGQMHCRLRGGPEVTDGYAEDLSAARLTFGCPLQVGSFTYEGSIRRFIIDDADYSRDLLIELGSYVAPEGATFALLDIDPSATTTTVAAAYLADASNVHDMSGVMSGDATITNTPTVANGLIDISYLDKVFLSGMPFYTAGPGADRKTLYVTWIPYSTTYANVFRIYEDANNYTWCYTQGISVTVRIYTAGVMTQLAWGGLDLADGSPPLTLALEFDGTSLRGWLDGVAAVANPIAGVPAYTAAGEVQLGYSVYSTSELGIARLFVDGAGYSGYLNANLMARTYTAPVNATDVLADYDFGSPYYSSEEHVFDLASNFGTDLTSQGGATLSTGQLRFDGTNSYWLYSAAGEVPFGIAGPVSKTAYVIATWDGTGSDGVFGIFSDGSGYGSGGNQVYVRSNGTNIIVESWDATNTWQLATLNLLEVGVEQTISLEFDGTTMECRQNGGLPVSIPYIPAVTGGFIQISAPSTHSHEGSIRRVFVDDAAYSRDLLIELGSYVAPEFATKALLDIDPAAGGTTVAASYEEADATDVHDMSGVMSATDFAKYGDVSLVDGDLVYGGTNGALVSSGGVQPFTTAGAGADQKTIYLAFTPEDDTNSYWLTLYGDANNYVTLSHNVAGYLIWQVRTAATGTLTENITASLVWGQRYVLALTFDGTSIYGRLNGGAQVTDLHVSDYSDPTGYFRLGHSATNWGANGSIHRCFVDGAGYSHQLNADLMGVDRSYPEGTTEALMDIRADIAPDIDSVIDYTANTQLTALTKTGNPLLTAGQFVFDGTTDELKTVDVPFGASTALAKNTFYLTYNSDGQSGTQDVLFTIRSSASYEAHVRIVSGIFTIEDASSGQIELGPVPTVGVDYLISLEFDGETISARINGGEETKYPNAVDLTGGTIELSNTASDYAWTGTMRRCFVDGAAYSPTVAAYLMADAGATPATAYVDPIAGLYTEALLDINAARTNDIASVLDLTEQTTSVPLTVSGNPTLVADQITMDGATDKLATVPPFITASATEKKTLYFVNTWEGDVGFFQILFILKNGGATSYVTSRYFGAELQLSSSDDSPVTRGRELGIVGVPLVLSVELDGTNASWRINGGAEFQQPLAPDFTGGVFELSDSTSTYAWNGTIDRVFIDGAGYSAAIAAALMTEAGALARDPDYTPPTAITEVLMDVDMASPSITGPDYTIDVSYVMTPVPWTLAEQYGYTVTYDGEYMTYGAEGDVAGYADHTVAAVPFETASTGVDAKTIYIKFKTREAYLGSGRVIFGLSGSGGNPLPGTNAQHCTIYAVGSNFWIYSGDATNGSLSASIGANPVGSAELVLSLEFNGTTVSARINGGAATTQNYIPSLAGGNCHIGYAGYGMKGGSIGRIVCDGAVYNAAIVAELSGTYTALTSTAVLDIRADLAGDINQVIDYTQITQVAPLTELGVMDLTADQFVFNAANDALALADGSDPIGSPTVNAPRTLYIVGAWTDATETAQILEIYQGPGATGVLFLAGGNVSYPNELTVYLDASPGYVPTGISRADDETMILSFEFDGAFVRIRKNGGEAFVAAWTITPAAGTFTLGRQTFATATHKGTVDRFFVDDAGYSTDVVEALATQYGVTTEFPTYVDPIAGLYTEALLDINPARATGINSLLDLSGNVQDDALTIAGVPTLVANQISVVTAGDMLSATGVPFEIPTAGAKKTFYIAFTWAGVSGFMEYLGIIQNGAITNYAEMRVVSGILSTTFNGTVVDLEAMIIGNPILLSMEFDGASVSIRVNAGSPTIVTHASDFTGGIFKLSSNISNYAWNGTYDRVFCENAGYNDTLARALMTEYGAIPRVEYVAPVTATDVLLDINGAVEGQTIDTVYDVSYAMLSAPMTKFGAPLLTDEQFVFDASAAQRMELAATPFDTAGAGADRKTIYVAFTVNSTSATLNYVWNFGQFGTRNCWIEVQNGACRFYTYDGVSGYRVTTLDISIGTGTEHVVSCEADGTNRTVRLDGATVSGGTQAWIPDYTDPNDGTRLGGSSGFASFDGSIRRFLVDGAGYNAGIVAELMGVDLSPPVGTTLALMDIRADIADSIDQVVDYTGATQNDPLTVAGNPLLTAGRFVFGGTTDMLTNATTPWKQATADAPWTVYWVGQREASATAQGVMFTLWNAAKSAYIEFLVVEATDTIRMVGTGVTLAEVGFVVPDEVFVFSVTFDGTGLTARINDSVPVYTTGDPDLSAGTFDLGRSTSTYTWEGSMDRCLVDDADYSQTVCDALMLTAGAVSRNYVKPAGATKALLDLNSAVTDSKDNVRDSSWETFVTAMTLTGQPNLTEGGFHLPGGNPDYFNADAAPFATAGTGADLKTLYVAFTLGSLAAGEIFRIGDSTDYFAVTYHSSNALLLVHLSPSGTKYANHGTLVVGQEYIIAIEFDGTTADSRLDGGALIAAAFAPDLSTLPYTRIGGISGVINVDVRRAFVDGAAYNPSLLDTL